MQKLKMQTPNLVDNNVEQISKIFPEVITEIKNENGELIKGIDFDLLKQKLSNVLVEGDNERYHLDWPGKKASLLKANTPIYTTLRPVIEDSVDFEKTENLYIEGDNFEVLKILQESYLGKVKMIYIDPPYNTGNDFIYKDKFSVAKEEYEDEIGVLDEDGGKLFKNTDSNGRFHSDWLSMMYERLVIARDLLKEDGVAFISIDDNEVHNLKKICDEIFGENNFITELVWEKKKKGTFLSNTITNIKEYILVFSKDIGKFKGLIGEINTSIETYPCVNESNKREIRTIPPGIESKFKESNYTLPKGSKISVNTMDLILHSNLVICDNILTEELVIEGNWRYSQSLINVFAEKKELYITQDLYIRRIVKDARYKTLKDILPRLGKNKDSKYKDFNLDDLFEDGWGSNEDGEEELRILMETKGILDFPKPVKLIEKFIASIRDDNCVILDFFSGSGTTAHAIMQLNAEDSGHRKFIMVQLPEKIDENAEAYKSGYNTITAIGKERIRRAGKKNKGEYLEKYNKELEYINKQLEQPSYMGDEELEDKKKEIELKIEHINNLDIGFRVYKTDTSNMVDVYYHPTETEQNNLFASNIKEDRTPEDLLTQVILDLGLELSLPIEKKEILGNDVFFVQTNALAACFDDTINFGIIDEIAELKPFKVVFKDASFKDDKDRINVEERFKRLSPETVVKVI